jgi:ketosteroid isomerase-like protein
MAQDARDARAALADAERAFARDGVEHGIRAAFIEHFAPDGIVFEPAPVRLREAWSARPPAPDPLALRLEWRPALVDVARAGDLGYSTGPFTLTDTRTDKPPSHGAFFSVWQRQPDGRWQVWLDLGSRTPGPVEESMWSTRPSAPDRPEPAMHATASTLRELDGALSGLDAATFAQRVARNARRYADGAAPLVGAQWTDARARDAVTADYAPAEARVSASGDLAATYGAIVERGNAGARAGHYVHVWLRNDAAWWLAVETVVYDGAR